MELQLVSYEQAKALKELEFPQDLVYDIFYFETLENANHILFYGVPIANEYIFCPSLEVAAKWLRDEKQMYIDVTFGYKQNNVVWCATLSNISHTGNSTLADVYFYSTYEQALSAGIDKAIEILKSKS